MTTHPLTAPTLTRPGHAWDWLVHVIPLAMAVTLLPRFVYQVAVLSVLHIALIHAFRLSPLALQYGILFLALLAVRVPPIRRWLITWRQQFGRAAAGHWQPSA